MEIKDV